MAHLDGRGGLGAAADGYVKQLTAVREKLAHLAIQVVREAPDETASVVRWRVSHDGERSGLTFMGPLARAGSTVEPLRTFLDWARREGGHGPVLFLYLGHGVGLTTEAHHGYLDVQSLRRVLEAEVRRSGKLYEVVALDTCFGASLETACELQGVAHYLTAAPGLMDSPGLDWRAALGEQASGAASGLGLVRGVVGQGMLGGRGGKRALVGLDLEKTEAAVRAAMSLASALREDIVTCGPAIALIRSRTMDWGERDELCDMGQWLAGMATSGPTSAVREAAGASAEALDAMVVARWLGPGVDTENMAYPPAGVGVYFPPSLEEVPTTYSRHLGFARTAGWAAFLTDYWEWARSELLGTLLPTSAVG